MTDRIKPNTGDLVLTYENQAGSKWTLYEVSETGKFEEVCSRDTFRRKGYVCFIGSKYNSYVPGTYEVKETLSFQDTDNAFTVKGMEKREGIAAGVIKALAFRNIEPTGFVFVKPQASYFPRLAN